jgi:hypothetical protein
MPKVKNVEKRIWDTEAFEVIIRYTNGRDMRRDKHDLRQYNKFECMAKNDVTVVDSKAHRDGNAVAGDTKLGTVRDSYADD